MKKILMSVALMAGVAVGYMMTGSNENEMNVSDLTSTNVEALAGGFCPFGCLDIKDIYCYCNDVHELKSGPDPETYM